MPVYYRKQHPCYAPFKIVASLLQVLFHFPHKGGMHKGQPNWTSLISVPIILRSACDNSRTIRSTEKHGFRILPPGLGKFTLSFNPLREPFGHSTPALRLSLSVSSAFRHWSASLALPAQVPTMPSADSCMAIDTISRIAVQFGLQVKLCLLCFRLVSRRCHNILSIPLNQTPYRSPGVRHRAFNA